MHIPNFLSRALRLFEYLRECALSKHFRYGLFGGVLTQVGSNPICEKGLDEINCNKTSDKSKNT